MRAGGRLGRGPEAVRGRGGVQRRPGDGAGPLRRLSYRWTRGLLGVRRAARGCSTRQRGARPACLWTALVRGRLGAHRVVQKSREEAAGVVAKWLCMQAVISQNGMEGGVWELLWGLTGRCLGRGVCRAERQPRQREPG